MTGRCSPRRWRSGALIGLTKVSWGGIMAGAVLLTAPMLVVFIALQRHFIAGIAAGAIK